MYQMSHKMYDLSVLSCTAIRSSMALFQVDYFSATTILSVYLVTMYIQASINFIVPPEICTTVFLRFIAFHHPVY